MAETWLTQIVSDRWFVASVAFCIGLLTGWVIWERRQRNDETAPGDSQISDQQTNPSHSQEHNQETLDALAHELENAQKLLEESQAESDAYNDILGNLDEAVKRANGRLKLIAKSIKRQ